MDNKELCKDIITTANIVCAIKHLLNARKVDPEKVDKLVKEMKELL